VSRQEVLFHFSEESSIARFEPHVAATAATDDALVWGIDADHQDLYFFPRECPRVTFHGLPSTTDADRWRFLGLSTARRVAAVEAGWLDRIRATQLYRYRLPAGGFEPREPNAGYWVSRDVVVPVGVEPVGDLLTALTAAGVEVRIVPTLWPLYEAVVASTLGFSIIRWHNAARP
jgi:hypothetical protein